MDLTYRIEDGGLDRPYGEEIVEAATLQIRADILAEAIHQLRPDLERREIALTVAEIIGARRPGDIGLVE